MSRPSVRFVPAALLGVAVLASLAWLPARATTARVSDEEALEHAMEEMNGYMRSWAKGIDAASRDKALEQVAKFQADVLTAKLQTPPMAAKIEEAKRAEFVAGYRRKLVDVLASSCKLEGALIDKNFEAANKVVKDELLRLKKEGHDTYQDEEEKEH